MNLPKEKDFKEGDVVFITIKGHTWLHETKASFNIPVSGRLAKISKIINWNTKDGKALLKQRIASGKWKESELKSRRFVLDIYYPELTMEGYDPGVKVPEVMSLYTDDDQQPLFDKWNPDLWKDLNNNMSSEFAIEIPEQEEGKAAPTKSKTKPSSQQAPVKSSRRRGAKVVSKSSL
jgi:hypothetical protein